MRIAASTKETIFIHDIRGPIGVDLSTLDYLIAVLPQGPNPEPTDYHPAIWDEDESAPGLLIGVDTDVPLEAGTTYDVWWTTVNGNEAPVQMAGPLKAF